VSSVERFSWEQVLAFRLHRHHLDRRAPRDSLPAVVRDVCGIQAQVMAAARIGLWARVSQLTREDVERENEGHNTQLVTGLTRGLIRSRR